MSKPIWIGVDLAKETFHIAVATGEDSPEHWDKLSNESFEHSSQGLAACVSWLKKQGILSSDLEGVCVESTGRLAMNWAKLTRRRLGPVSIVNPARTNAFGKSLGIRDKSDSIEARVLAIYGKIMRPEPIILRTEAENELCELSRLYDALEQQYRANQNRLGDGPSSSKVKQILRKSIQSAAKQMQDIEESMDKLIKSNVHMTKDAKLMQTIKGVGLKTVRVVMAEFGDLRNYGRNELSALAGTYPKGFTSGTSVFKKPRLAKGGKGNVRRRLYMCAMSAVRYNPHMRKFAKQLKSNGKVPMEVLCAVMRKLLLIMRAIVISGIEYDPTF